MKSNGRWMVALGESGVMPDITLRQGIRRLLKQRRQQISNPDGTSRVDIETFISMLNRSSIANIANVPQKQHYQIPAAFFRNVLGTSRKYSCNYWPSGTSTLESAEVAALEFSVKYAEIEDGMSILDLGCGWGALSLWVARRFPKCRVTAVSLSPVECAYINSVADDEGLDNVQTIVADINIFHSDVQFDRIVAIGLFEHIHNYAAMFERIASWLKPDGAFYMNTFCHHQSAYEYFDTQPSDWICRHFFSGGVMPCLDLPRHFQQHLKLQDHQSWDGMHFAKTASAWLQNMDRNRAAIVPLLEQNYGQENGYLWWTRWRIFFLSVAEMFAYNDGKEWLVGHYLFGPKGSRTDKTAH